MFRCPLKPCQPPCLWASMPLGTQADPIRRPLLPTVIDLMARDRAPRVTAEESGEILWDIKSFTEEKPSVQPYDYDEPHRSESRSMPMAMLWTANPHGQWTHCGVCDLRLYSMFPARAVMVRTPRISVHHSARRCCRSSTRSWKDACRRQPFVRPCRRRWMPIKRWMDWSNQSRSERRSPNCAAILRRGQEEEARGGSAPALRPGNLGSWPRARVRLMEGHGGEHDARRAEGDSGAQESEPGHHRGRRGQPQRSGSILHLKSSSTRCTYSTCRKSAMARRSGPVGPTTSSSTGMFFDSTSCATKSLPTAWARSSF